MSASPTVRKDFGRVLAKQINRAWWHDANRPGVIIPMTKVTIGMFAHYIAICDTQDYLAIAQNANDQLLHDQIPARVTCDPVNQEFLVEFEPRLPV